MRTFELEMAPLIVLCITLFFNYGLCANPEIEAEEIQAIDFMQILDKESGKNTNKVTIVSWDYDSNLTDINLQKKLAVEVEVAQIVKEYWNKTVQFNWQSFKDADLRRKFKKYSILGAPALPEDKYKRLNKLIADMSKIYATAKICDFKNKEKCDLALEPQMEEILTTSNDPEELKHVWVEWRKAVGPKCRHLYKDYVDLKNESAHLNNFTDMTEFWLHSYEDPDFRNNIELLWQQFRPLYQKIHAYARYKLREKYGDNVVSEKGPIPAHLMGNMWAQNWLKVAQLGVPHPDANKEDVEAEMKKQNYTAEKIFKVAEEFFVSINMSSMSDTFWKRSIIEKPTDREIICHASAWDFYDGDDFRIKQCTEIDIHSFNTAHHEMGHIEYFMQYKDQPVVYREGANDGFHEAVGDLIGLSASSQKHLKKIGLLKGESDEKTILNDLYRRGLEKIVFLPFGYLMDLWRWDIFSGKTSSKDYNCRWWALREEYQGIEPPVDRSELDFDPAAKYHIVADVPYLRYFISFVIQFQFHKAVCLKAGQYDPKDPSKPLHDCDIYGNTDAGNALKQMLSMGSSKPWPDAMEALTGSRQMDAEPLLEYFKPLRVWLDSEIKEKNIHVGWEKSTKVCRSSA